MNWNLNGQSADVEQALAGGSPQRAGWFRFHFADQRWEWSEQVRRMHGYEPGSVTPTTDLVLAHKHPDDRRQVAATIDQILNTHKAFSTRHRIIDTSGNVRSVVVVGDQLHDDQGGVIGTHGFYVDVSPLPDQEREDLVTAKLAEINGAGVKFSPRSAADAGQNQRAATVVWEWTGAGNAPVAHHEPLSFEYVHLAQRSYK